MAEDWRRQFVEGQRLLDELAELGKIGRANDGSISRLAFTPSFLEGRALVQGFMSTSGLTTWVDAAGNLFGRFGPVGRRPGDRVVIVGSHLDTVPAGGLFDGAYGVLASIAAVRALARVDPDRAENVVIVGFCNEEGAFGTAAMTGSRALAGRLGTSELAHLDDGGATLADRLAFVSGQDASLEEAVWAPDEITCYLELHIEQGERLERAKVPLGLVRVITGRTSFDVEISGLPSHAGTTPMGTRRDALAAAAEVVLLVEGLAVSNEVRVATIGDVSVTPGARNVVPGRAHLVGEFRDTSSQRMKDALKSLRSRLSSLGERRDVRIDMAVIDVVEPTETDPDLRSLIAKVAQASSTQFIELDSAAGHDAQAIAQVARVAMLFVPSASGISHAAGEFTSPVDLLCGLEVLTGVVAPLARNDVPPHVDHPSVSQTSAPPSEMLDSSGWH
ncbi:MAG TPA: Zn-dependent hydrolase [Acidimicrobiales bacterium]|nr:Zn-dependent hydrolase [Acidimicrobiales bacterium]